MKFSYQYRTADNVLHHGIVRAASREAAFRSLKGQGVRPARLDECGGFLDKVVGKGKRWSLILILSVLSAVLSLMLLDRDSASCIERRSQIYGDPSIIQNCASKGWRNVFAEPGDLLLAKFAQPGARVEPLTETERVAASENLSVLQGLNNVPEDIPPECQRMIRIVNWMRQEFYAYVNDGGSASNYVNRLEDRQRVERRIVESYADEFSRLMARGVHAGQRTKCMVEWERINAVLRKMGLKSVPTPEEWEE